MSLHKPGGTDRAFCSLPSAMFRGGARFCVSPQSSFVHVQASTEGCSYFLYFTCRTSCSVGCFAAPLGEWRCVSLRSGEGPPSLAHLLPEGKLFRYTHLRVGTRRDPASLPGAPWRRLRDFVWLQTFIRPASCSTEGQPPVLNPWGFVAELTWASCQPCGSQDGDVDPSLWVSVSKAPGVTELTGPVLSDRGRGAGAPLKFGL